MKNKLPSLSLSHIYYIIMAIIFIIAFILSRDVEEEKVNEIPSLHIEAEIQDNGSVIIRDQRQVLAKTGTEHFISLGSLGESSLLDVTVYDGSKQALDYIYPWNIEASLKEKAGKYGIYQDDGFTEISFGLGKHGRSDFLIEYELSNFIFDLEDGHQAFYWQFINPGMDPIQDLEIRVTNASGHHYTFPETRFWAFGHGGGFTEITDQSLIMTAGDSFETDDYVVLLGIFEGRPFNTTSYRYQTSEELIEKAMVGADIDGVTYEDFKAGQVSQEAAPDGGVTSGNFISSNSSSYQEYTDPSQPTRKDRIRESILSVIISILFFFLQPRMLVLTVIVIILTYIGLVIYAIYRDRKDRAPRFKATVAKDEYYRDIPYHGDFSETEQLTEADISNIISAYILKWFTEGRLQETSTQIGWLFKVDTLGLILNPDAEEPSHPAEARLWKIFLAATGDDQVLDHTELSSYAKKNLNTYLNFVNEIRKQSKAKMMEEGYLQKVIEKGFFGLRKKEVIDITDKGQSLLNNIQAFKNYLRDFSLIDEREIKEASLWQDLLIWAAYLGIAEEVYDQFVISNPQFESQTPYNRELIRQTSSFSYTVHQTAMEEHHYRTSSSSSSSSTSRSYSGGGGSSASGGGSGASGGGRGGGTR